MVDSVKPAKQHLLARPTMTLILAKDHTFFRIDLVGFMLVVSKKGGEVCSEYHRQVVPVDEKLAITTLD